MIEEIESDQYLSNVNQPNPFSALLHHTLSILKWLIRFFTLTDEDCLKAGIYVDRVGRDG